MSRSITFNDVDFAPWTTAEVMLPGAHAVAVEAAEAPGRDGALALSARLAAKAISVRMFLDLDDDHDAEGLTEVRHGLAAALACTEGAELELPGETGLSYRDAYCTDSSGWSHLFEDGYCELLFTALDPVAWGQAYSVYPASYTGSLSFVVGGTWRTAPTVSMTAAAGNAVAVEEAATGARVEVAGPFVGGEEVVVDCGARRAYVDGEAANAGVSIGSDYFCLETGARTLSFEGCSACSVGYVQRWL